MDLNDLKWPKITYNYFTWPKMILSDFWNEFVEYRRDPQEVAYLK